MKDKENLNLLYVLFIIYYFLIYFLARNAKKDWGKPKKKNLNSSMIQLRDQLHNHNLDSE